MLISGEYRLGVVRDEWVVIYPRRQTPLVFVFCLVSLWLGVWASGLVLLRTPEPIPSVDGILAINQVAFCFIIMAILVKNYWVKTLVFDGTEGQLLREGRVILDFSDLRGLEIKADQRLILHHLNGRRWCLRNQVNPEELNKMGREIERISGLPLLFETSEKQRF